MEVVMRFCQPTVTVRALPSLPRWVTVFNHAPASIYKLDDDSHCLHQSDNSSASFCLMHLLRVPHFENNSDVSLKKN